MKYMKLTRRKLSMFFLLLMGVAGASAETLSLRVQPITGKAQQEVLSAIGKMVYHGDSLYVYDYANNVLFYEALSKVRYVAFTEEDNPATAISSSESKTVQLLVYPNPTQGQLQIRNAEGEMVRVYDTQGKSLITTQLQDGNATIDVSALPIGTYILLVQNGVFRFIKE